MAELHNCLLPDDLLYSVPNNVWVRVMDDQTLEMGMTDIAQTMAGGILHCRPKKVGKNVKLGKSLATVESGKWVGPVRSPFSGEIVEVNQAVEADATILNKSPYTDGWIVRLKPADFEGEKGDLSSVEQAVKGFHDYMVEKEMGECIHCEGFDG